MFARILIAFLLQVTIGFLVLPETDASDIDAQGLYQKHCVLCHGEDGAGKTDLGEGLGASDFNDKAFQDTTTDEQILEQITNGTEDKMFAFKDQLTPEEIQTLVLIVRGFGR